MNPVELQLLATLDKRTQQSAVTMMLKSGPIYIAAVLTPAQAREAGRELQRLAEVAEAEARPVTMH